MVANYLATVPIVIMSQSSSITFFLRGTKSPSSSSRVFFISLVKLASSEFVDLEILNLVVAIDQSVRE